MEKSSSYKKVIFCSTGIFFSYLLYGFLQEKITKSHYNGEKFAFYYCFLLTQCLFNAIFSYILIAINKTPTANLPPYYMNFICGCTYTLAMLASNISLKWVNYPTQVIGKSVKPIPVMLLGVLFGKVRHHFTKYIYVTTITIGVILFMYNNNEDNVSKFDGSKQSIGILLLISSLLFDGLTGAIQERMRRQYTMTSFHLMLNLNVWAAFILFIASLIANEILPFHQFCLRNPSVIWDISLFSLSSALGQCFIFMAITHLGPLTCSIITTTRKLFTILLSVLLFGNKLVTYQWVGVMLVFTGLTLDSKKKKHA